MSLTIHSLCASSFLYEYNFIIINLPHHECSGLQSFDIFFIIFVRYGDSNVEIMNFLKFIYIISERILLSGLHPAFYVLDGFGEI